MTRNVNLVSYLPPFLQEYDTYRATLEAENPEFKIVWDAANRVLYNEFIATADEYGISRFEKLLKIYPSKEDTLESRRLRVQIRWFDELPYTMITLLERLIMLCGENNFTLTDNFETGYTLTFQTCLEIIGQAEELDNIFRLMLPCNIIVDSRNTIPCAAGGNFIVAGGVCFAWSFLITNDDRYDPRIDGVWKMRGGAMETAYVMISNDSREKSNAKGKQILSGAAMSADRVEISNDFEESLNVNGKQKFKGGVMSTEQITASNDYEDSLKIDGAQKFKGGVMATENITASNDFEESTTAKGLHMIGGVSLHTFKIEVSNDFSEDFKVEGIQKMKGGVMSADHITATNDFKETVNIETPENISGGVSITEIISAKGDK